MVKIMILLRYIYTYICRLYIYSHQTRSITYYIYMTWRYKIHRVLCNVQCVIFYQLPTTKPRIRIQARKAILLTTKATSWLVVGDTNIIIFIQKKSKLKICMNKRATASRRNTSIELCAATHASGGKNQLTVV